MTELDQRVDEVDKYYKPVKNLDYLSNILFYIGAMLSISIPFLTKEQVLLSSTVPVVFIVSVLLYAFVVSANSYYFIPFAERQRRRQLLSNSLAVPLSFEETNKYYNNKLDPNVLKLGANLMENSFFGKHICERMLVKERIKVFLYAAIWLFVAIYRGSDLGLVLAASQLLFASEIVFRWIKLEILRVRNERVFDSLYSLYLGHSQTHSPTIEAGVLDAFAEYEAAKASAAVKLSTKVFRNMNEELTQKWERVRSKLQM
ncbi:MAG TPA: hypothetical protein DD644_02725 [Halomonas sp.]|uniref:hypothetical protein n=1 Tax=Halomonadaceae TaxID=28256 RepID=UPI000E96E532|nr:MULTISPECIES: hypothetical protein [unclassified Halomonas]HBP40658.1 hypothetical protein [Halomonas sp.]HBS81982.1 hypothetical protein [Halomonas campaniensis]